LPLLVSMLNLVGVLPAARLIKWQRIAIFLIFVFAAVATPSTDPLSMLFLAVPMTVLYGIAEILAHLADRRRRRAQKEPPGSLG
jgi:sec-independent protein translocase protein TatC